MRSEQTGVTFVNALAETDTLTVLDYEYLYNGGGVGVGDVNNDGRMDLYFTGNMVTSRLYLNKGNWQFEDITASAGVGTEGWANGVAMVDVNQDGLKDIYVCMGGYRSTPREEMANLLFVNNGDNTFTEAAARYGLDNTGFSVQAAFLDYDRDGDLDAYLLQNALVDYNRSIPRPRRTRGQAASTDVLYRNNGDGTFSNVSAAAGVQTEGFGLGVVVSDVNQDGWPDVYVANDFLTNDLLYVNRGDGTFVDEAPRRLKHQSYAGMGSDVADVNNDGLVDIFVLDMLPEDPEQWKRTNAGNRYEAFHASLARGYEPQYTRNTLQRNNGNGTFSEIGQLAGVAATDWSWAALFADFDLDGRKDLFVANGYPRAITNLDFMTYGRTSVPMGTREANRQRKVSKLKMLAAVKTPNYVFRNRGNLTFEDVSAAWGITEPSFSNGAAYADLDNDGDLDLVINNIDQEAALYRNRLREAGAAEENAEAHYLRVVLRGPAGNSEGLGTNVYVRAGGVQQHRYHNPYRGYESTVGPVLHFGLGRAAAADTVAVRWPDGKTQRLVGVPANRRVVFDHADARAPAPAGPLAEPAWFEAATGALGLGFRHRENAYVDFEDQPLLLHMHSRLGPGLAVADVTGDARQDLFVGGAAGQPGALFVQGPGGRFARDAATAPLWQADRRAEDLGALFFDANGDGAEDLYVVSGGAARAAGAAAYEDRLYLGDGRGGFRKAAAGALPAGRASGACVVGADYDRDGDLDLFVCGRVVPGAAPTAPASMLLRNDTEHGRVRFTPRTEGALPGGPALGMASAALWSDFDDDGWVDLVVTGEFMPVRFFRNLGGERAAGAAVRFAEVTGRTGLPPMRGWWNSLAGGDFDRDGDTDYVAGNLGRNTRYRVGPEAPLCIHARDYDADGRLDPVASYVLGGERHLAHARDDLIAQIRALAVRFPDYESYASVRFEEAFLPEELEGAEVVCAERFVSSYLENRGGGRFRVRALPVEAQLAPVFGMRVGDYDADGHLDVLLVGNSYAPEVGTGRYDAMIGVYLRGNGEGAFEVVDVRRSGFFVDGDAKALATLAGADGRPVVVVSRNDGAVEALRARRPAGRWLAARRGDAYALVRGAGGRTEKREFYYGAGYLAQSARGLWLDPDATAVTIVDFRGRRRTVVPGAATAPPSRARPNRSVSSLRP